MVKTIHTLLCCSLLFVSPAQALTLINDDQTTYTVEIVVGEGDSQNESYELQFDYMLEDICQSGCTIKLSNGAAQDFNGAEYVIIRDGKFVATD